jgi:hypothetical protein
MSVSSILGGSGPAESRPVRRVLGRRRGTGEAQTEIGEQKRYGGGAGGHWGAQGSAAEARGRDPQAERPLRGPGVPEARGREVEPAQPRAGRDRGAHHRAPSPLRAASSRSVTTARAGGYPIPNPNGSRVVVWSLAAGIRTGNFPPRCQVLLSVLTGRRCRLRPGAHRTGRLLLAAGR